MLFNICKFDAYFQAGLVKPSDLASGWCSSDLHGANPTVTVGPKSALGLDARTSNYGSPRTPIFLETPSEHPGVDDNQNPLEFLNSKKYLNLSVARKAEVLLPLLHRALAEVDSPSAVWRRIYEELRICPAIVDDLDDPKALLMLLIRVFTDEPYPNEGYCDRAMAAGAKKVEVRDLLNSIITLWQQCAQTEDKGVSYWAVIADGPLGKMVGILDGKVREHANAHCLRFNSFLFHWVRSANYDERTIARPLADACLGYSDALKRFFESVNLSDVAGGIEVKPSAAHEEKWAQSIFNELCALSVARANLGTVGESLLASINRNESLQFPRLADLAEHCRIFATEAYVPAPKSAYGLIETTTYQISDVVSKIFSKHQLGRAVLRPM
jgi:hypothetical protein